MTSFARHVAELTGVDAGRLRRLAGGDLSEVLLVDRPGAAPVVAKAASSASEAAMLRRLAAGNMPVPRIEAEHEGVLLLEHVIHDGRLDAAWGDIGAQVARLHGQQDRLYGWPADHSLGTVAMDNRRSDDWPAFWGEQRLVAVSALMDRPWRDRVERLAHRMSDLLPRRPPAALLHGDLWGGNLLVRDGRLAALIDPACYHGHGEVDLAMLHLFDRPSADFEAAYGALEPGWEERRILYQLFPALVHLRLFGSAYAALSDRLLRAAEAL